MKNLLRKNISEETAKKICRNIAIALQMSNIAFYETQDWIEIVYDRQCIGLHSNYNVDDKNKTKFKCLLNDALLWLFTKEIITKFSIEHALINIDLQENHEINKQ